MNIGDRVYVIRHHVKNRKNIGYYVHTGKICEPTIKGHSSKYAYVELSKNDHRMYLKSRLFMSYEEALKECKFKNKEKQLRDKYNKQKQLLRKENNA